MDADRFDTLLRSLSETPSRRGALRVLGGLGLAGLLGHADAEAKKRRKKKRKKKKTCGNCGPCQTCRKGKCTPQADGIDCGGGKTCEAGTCTCATACCADADCGTGRICAQGQCVTGQGTCAPGADWCLNGTATCGGESCRCLITKANQTRCGEARSLSGCATCATDAACATLFPNTPGAFCADASGVNCCSAAGQGGCFAPCPS